MAAKSVQNCNMFQKAHMGSLHMKFERESFTYSITGLFSYALNPFDKQLDPIAT